ncbi:unnamed protein product, partial [Polarella glacialis]
MSSLLSTGKRRSQQRDGNLAEKYQASGQCTTVMVRNIPLEYSQDDLIAEVSDAMGSPDLFDFFYLPWDSQNGGNIGYAFVNFLDCLGAQVAVRVFSNYHFRMHDSKKIGKVSPAHIQGLENNLRHLQDRAIVLGNHPCSPVVMWKGRKVDLSLIFQELRTQDTVRKVETGQSWSGSRDGRKAEEDLFGPGSGACVGEAFGLLLDVAAGLTPGMTPLGVPTGNWPAGQQVPGNSSTGGKFLVPPVSGSGSRTCPPMLPPGSGGGNYQRVSPHSTDGSYAPMGMPNTSVPAGVYQGSPHSTDGSYPPMGMPPASAPSSGYQGPRSNSDGYSPHMSPCSGSGQGGYVMHPTMVSPCSGSNREMNSASNTFNPQSASPPSWQ